MRLEGFDHFFVDAYFLNTEFHIGVSPAHFESLQDLLRLLRQKHYFVIFEKHAQFAHEEGFYLKMLYFIPTCDLLAYFLKFAVPDQVKYISMIFIHFEKIELWLRFLYINRILQLSQLLQKAHDLDGLLPQAE